MSWVSLACVVPLPEAVSLPVQQVTRQWFLNTLCDGLLKQGSADNFDHSTKITYSATFIEVAF